MGDIHPRSNSQDPFLVEGFGRICRACKSFISKCYPKKKSIFLFEMGNIIKKPKSMEHNDTKPSKYKNQKSTKKRNPDRDKNSPQEKNRMSLKGSFRRRSCDNTMTPSPQWSPPVHRNAGPSMLSRTMSHGSSSPMTRSTSKKFATGRASLLRTMSQINSTDAPPSSTSAALPRSLSRSMSRMGPIIYSNKNGLMKPPANEQQLDCTLEELCFGCVKKIKIARDAIMENGDVVQEDETFTIKVSPGWRKGTKITFEDKGNKMPGTGPADVIFTVAEKKHLSFTRKEDDLELKFDIPLVKALTGCALSVPLLGGHTLSLTIDDVINPGYEKVIPGQGMPKQNEPVTRGNLIITFSVKFPDHLTDKQRSDAANILRQVC